MIVTIDGPAGAGKSTIARQLAKQLGFAFLDTGAMYRVVALAGLREQCDWNEPDQLTKVAAKTEIILNEQQVLLNGEDVSAEIRTPEVTRVTRHSANNDSVRRLLIVQQQKFAQQNNNVVTEGRDQGTLVFPDAACKIFLTASPEERARRRVKDFTQQGKEISLEEVLSQQNNRDAEDQSRELGALKKADDAVEVLTDGLSQQEVVEKLIELINLKSTEI